MDATVAWTIDPDITMFNYVLFNFYGETIKKFRDIHLTKSETEQTWNSSDRFLMDSHPAFISLRLKTNKTNIPQRIKFLIH